VKDVLEYRVAETSDEAVMTVKASFWNLILKCGQGTCKADD
jgi:hypothetical protein